MKKTSGIHAKMKGSILSEKAYAPCKLKDGGVFDGVRGICKGFSKCACAGDGRKNFRGERAIFSKKLRDAIRSVSHKEFLSPVP